MLFVVSISTAATTHYVNWNNPAPLAPYTNWASAATNIQSAVNVSVSGDTVLVTNGLYNTGSAAISGTSRVAMDSKAVFIRSVNGPAVTTIAGYQVPGTTNGASAIRCAYLANGAVLAGFTLTQGATTTSFPYGGGVYCQSSSSIISNCILSWNSASSIGGAAYNGTFVNCVFFGNSAGNLGGAAQNCRMINCTVVSNTAPSAAALNDCRVWNSIVYYNSKTGGSGDTGGEGFTNCCINPVPSSNTSNIISNAPQFVNLAAGDLHLQMFSPCVNAGNNSFITNTVDLDGNPRVVGSAVDLGAYESALSVVHCVSPNSTTPVPPYTNWPTAATNIQDAIDVSIAGEVVLVSNGVYRTGGRLVYGTATNRVTIDKPITVQSVNGPAVTSIGGAGAGPNGGIRCAYMSSGAYLSGFTLSNGVTRYFGDNIQELSGGGVWCESSSAIISNCIVANNYANQGGGGVFQGTLINCTLSNNQAFIRGGGACLSTLNSCLLNTNNVVQGSGGGGAFGGTLSNCLLIANSAYQGGGAQSNTLINCSLVNNWATFGAGTYQSTLNRCSLLGNHASNSGGGMWDGVANNCLIATNTAAFNGGGAKGLYFLAISNCTIVANSASSRGGGIYPGTSNAIVNSIIFYNDSPSGPDVYFAPKYYSCCPDTFGAFNISSPPMFVDLAGGDYHLQTNSPCINSGKNSNAPPGPDLDGNARIVGGTVDIGAYEFPSPASIISYAWLQQYGFATDGSADFTDPDGDGMNNYKEWRCQTDPTDPTSVLIIQSVVPDGTNGNVVTWQSVEGLLYYLQRSSGTGTNAQLAFALIQTNIVGLAGTTSYTDNTATGPGPYFYRIQVP
jgi:hypothetical protein